MTWFLNSKIYEVRLYVNTFPSIFLRKKGVAKTEIKAFKASIDDLLDVAADLESRFFYLPKIEGFEETSRELSLL